MPSFPQKITGLTVVRVLMRNYKGKASLKIVDLNFTDLSEKTLFG